MENDRAYKSRPEILAPAGNYEGFLACINAGADAVYFGGNKFGARAFADNFSDEEIVKAIKYAHIFGVKVYLTVNTLIKEREFDEVYDYIKPFADAGLDACIIQDIGLIGRFGEWFPNVEIHVSTQAFSTGINSVRYFKELGAKRVVPARELSLKEIKYIKDNVDIEIECFVHGAMCYCYSGQCLFSSTYGKRSGNRGRCAGPCRLSYMPLIDGKVMDEAYVLSMKDLCALPLLDRFIDAKIDSFKIEGRMKSPEYSAFTTDLYKRYTDMYIDTGKLIISKEDSDALRHMYMRSFTGTGYADIKNSRDMLTLESPAYSGNDDDLIRSVRERFISKNRKLKIAGYFYAHKDNDISLTLSYEDKSVTVSGSLPEKAVKTATDEASVKKQLSKLNDTPFEWDELTVDIDDDIFMPVSGLNELRRRAVKELTDEF